MGTSFGPEHIWWELKTHLFASQQVMHDTLTEWYVFLLFHMTSSPSPFSVSAGCDFWTDAEKSLFTAALETHGKDFALIEKTVKKGSALTIIHETSIKQFCYVLEVPQKLLLYNVSLFGHF